MPASERDQRTSAAGKALRTTTVLSCLFGWIRTVEINDDVWKREQMLEDVRGITA